MYLTSEVENSYTHSLRLAFYFGVCHFEPRRIAMERLFWLSDEA